MNTKILWIDVWKASGYYFNEDNYWTFSFASLHQYYIEGEKLIHDFAPEVIACWLPTRFYNTIKMHYAMLAIIELLCERYNITFLWMIDSSAKKLVLWNWRADKKMIMDKLWIKDKEIADAKMFALAWKIKLTQ